MRKGTNQTRYYKKQIISNRITSIPVWWCRLLVGEWYPKRPRFNSLTSPLQLRPQPHPRLLQYVRQFDSKSKNKSFTYFDNPFLIPADCTWKYFSCTSHSSRCKAEFRKCSDGKSRKCSMRIFFTKFSTSNSIFSLSWQRDLRLGGREPPELPRAPPHRLHKILLLSKSWTQSRVDRPSDGLPRHDRLRHQTTDLQLHKVPSQM